MSTNDSSTRPLTPYAASSSNNWSHRDAAHLLWRAQFGASPAEIERATAEGLQATVDRLTRPQDESAEFQATEPILRQAAFDTSNITDLKAWWLYRMLYSANPLVEKMSLFWHNHFATSYTKVQSVRHMADQNDLIRRHAVGSFRELLHGMARDVAMLIWLDSNSNRKRHANENFAREVMELFSLDVGNYSETDIKEAARAFTGWHVREGEFWFNELQHDADSKSVLGKSGAFDGDEVIDICLAQNACPRFLAKKLLHVFVSPEPAPELIETLAGRIRAHDYEMSDVMRELLSSQAFFAPENRRSIIKSPLDLVLGGHRTLQSRANLQATATLVGQLGQDVFEPPTVKGWDGGRLWISSATLLQRANFAAELTKGTNLGRITDPQELIAQQKLRSPAAVVSFFVELLLADDLESNVAQELETHVRNLRGDRDERLHSLIHVIMTMPEYQLM